MGWLEFAGFIIVPVLTYFAGVSRGRGAEVARARDDRVSRVVAEYGRLAYGHPPLDTGLRAFTKAGAKDLETREEIIDSVRRIIGRWGSSHHPLGARAADLLGRADLRDIIQSIDVDTGEFDNDYQMFFLG